MYFVFFREMREYEKQKYIRRQISVHVSLGMRGADTREDVSCFCWVRERGMWDWFLIDERIV